ncbi:MAG: hypothetical protein AAFP70_19260 [Calditrichota bacterium]
MRNCLLFICLFMILPLEILPQYQNRNHYQNRLEPINSILHGAGQDGGQLATVEKDAFDTYSTVMPANSKPMVYMYYEALRNIGANWAGKLKNDLLAYGDSLIVIQFGLELVGQTEIIPTGALDDDIEDLLNS